jgi:hypothetical protein
MTQTSELTYRVAGPGGQTLRPSAASAGETSMFTESTLDVGHLRSQLKAVSTNAERVFERAFDLRQAGAPEDRVDAAMAELSRLQERARQLREQLGTQPVLH